MLATRTPLKALAGALLAVAAIVPTASASLLTAPVATVLGTSAACQARVLSQPFTPWGDQSSYFPVASGSFEQGAAGWTLTRGATLVGGGDPFVAGSAGTSLSLPAGATATAPATCVDLAAPTLRMFAQGTGGTVVVSVTTAGLTLPLGSFRPNGTWAPSPVFAMVTNTLGALSLSGTVNATFHFTAAGGAVQLDDVLVDPYRRT
jgi:hypothetical protein